MPYLRTPRNYRAQENPLFHDFEYNFKLGLEQETKNSTIVTLFHQKELAGMEAIEVNPQHPSYAEDGGATVYSGSIVPRVSVQLTAKINQTAFEADAIRHCIFKWMPIYTVWLSQLEAKNTGVPSSDIQTIIEMTFGTGKKVTYPLFSGVDLTAVGDRSPNQPLSTISETEVFGDYGLTTDASLESVAFDEDAFWDAKRRYSNKGMLNKVTGSMKTVYLDYERKPYHFSSNNFTNPSVKRANPYMFCGILIHVPQASHWQQLPDSADVNASADQISFGVHVNFQEWNVDFDQTSV